MHRERVDTLLANQIVFLSSGQTGVERGVCLAALGLGLPVAGIMQSGGLDEMGPIPQALAQHLVPCSDRGFWAASHADIEGASVVVIAVPDANTPSYSPR